MASEKSPYTRPVMANIFLHSTSETGNQYAHEVEFARGNYIYSPGEKASHIFYLHQGRIKIGTFDERGRGVAKAIIEEGELFGEAALFNENTRRSFARALTKCEVYKVRTEEFHELMKIHKSLAPHIIQLMGERLIEMEKRIEDFLFKDSRTRVIHFIHDLGLKNGINVEGEILIRKFMTHQEIADLTSTSRQTVTLVMNELRQKNLLIFNRQRILIRDLDGIRAISEAS